MNEQDRIDYESEEAYLIAAGILKPPERDEMIDWEAFQELPGAAVSEEAMRDAIAWAKGSAVDDLVDRMVSEGLARKENDDSSEQN